MKSLVAIGALCVLSLAGPAAAGPDPDVRPMNQAIRYDDLDLRTDAGARELAGRIRWASGEVCARAVGRWNSAYAGCVQRSIDSAAAASAPA